MSLSFVAFVSCEDKEEPVNNENTQTEDSNGGNGSNTGSNGDNSGNTSGDSNGNVSAVSVFKSGTQDGHDYVDLGLTSGTMWATANVGAKTPQDYGNYYAWGEVTTKEVYNWETYKYANGDYNKLTKYCNDSKYGKNGFTDDKKTLELSDDAAKTSWGGKWRIPTFDQQKELYNECYWVWTESYNNSNVKGYIVYKAKVSSDKGVKIYNSKTPSSSYSLSDAHIFMPAAGYRPYGDLYDAGSSGFYWSSSMLSNPLDAQGIYFGSGDIRCGVYNGSSVERSFGRSVRAVIS